MVELVDDETLDELSSGISLHFDGESSHEPSHKIGAVIGQSFDAWLQDPIYVEHDTIPYPL